jgi:negative regulator of flagellin synthesis FlgM
VKIGSSFDARRPGDLTGAKPATSQSKPADASSQPAADVRLSDLSTKLADLETRLAGTEAFDVKRIDEIKQAISEGRFKVNSEAVADKLIANVQEMLNGKKA